MCVLTKPVAVATIWMLQNWNNPNEIIPMKQGWSKSNKQKRNPIDV